MNTPTSVLFRLAVVTLCATTATLGACGTEEEVVPDAATDSGTDAVSDADADADDGGADTTVDCGPLPGVACLTNGCPEGQECIYSEDACYPSGCTCVEATGQWVCENADCQYGYACLPDDGCEGPDPSVTCLDTGCPGEQQCLPIDADQCVPSSCSCGDDGNWICTDDCGQPYACSDATDLCPTEPPIGESCPRNELECSWGSECCCGQCYPSMVCTCSGDSWACYATDACMIPSCEGQACDDDSDCEGGAGTDLSCVDGVCGGDNRARCGELDSDRCETVSSVHCEWVEPAGCVTEVGPPILGAAGCFPYGDCADDSECPDGYFCEVEIQANPRCAWEEPLCDSCREVRSLCVPRGI